MIAKTILQQIGGNRFATMTGSKDFIDLGNGLRMNLSRNKTSANRLDILLDEKSIFNKNIDEFLYFFEATGYEVVFFEDAPFLRINLS